MHRAPPLAPDSPALCDMVPFSSAARTGVWQEQLLECGGISSARLDGGGFSRLPQSPPLWGLLAPSLVSLSLNSNALLDLPPAVGDLQQLRRLSLEGNLFRELPPPVLQLHGLRELSAGRPPCKTPPAVRL